ncbi:radical SAM protein [Pleionea sp. CnH1-48]|uniref:radical SAM protein n=1 Tax=Pleionea sp. CnH1-48 TaxID=2954494 RepID=UPI002096D9A3|nr:radical SAM protein [Pleionea sp. CnH1-48]MCO7223408.1 radical SAM protein [Pleionea sp. CnH1-48]
MTTAYFHLTVLSNFIKGFNKYQKVYDKSNIKGSRYPGVFFVLEESEIDIGVNKASRLLEKLNIPDDRIIVMEALLHPHQVRQNDITETQLGQYIEGDQIKINRVFDWCDGKKIERRCEDLMADSYRINGVNQQGFSELKPRSLSFLPVAKGCQAKCSFCFSTASISAEQKQTTADTRLRRAALEKAVSLGINRAVITGGGEPGLLPLPRLLELIALCREYVSKVVLITNGYSLINSRDPEEDLNQLEQAGLTVLSVSRHHFSRHDNARLMGLDIESEKLAQVFRARLSSSLKLRWVCVLQKGGIDSTEKLHAYIEWSMALGVAEICFKELYVSSSSESIYFDRAANDWSYRHQVPLSLVLELAQQQQWELVETLPWGCPVYRIQRGASSIKVAAYTEPSVSWEFANGMCRSWNMMANGDVYASLESKDSIIHLDRLAL